MTVVLARTARKPPAAALAYTAGRTSARPLASLLGVEPAQVICLFGRR